MRGRGIFTIGQAGQTCVLHAAQGLARCTLGSVLHDDKVHLEYELTPIKPGKKAQHSLAVSDDVNADEVPADNASTLTRDILGADLALSASAPNGAVPIGDDVALTLAVDNLGPANSKGAVVEFVYPGDQLTFKTASGTGAACSSAATGKLTCALGDFGPTATDKPNFTVIFTTVKSGTAQVFITAIDGGVGDDNHDHVLSNNGKVLDVVVSGPDLSAVDLIQAPSNDVPTGTTVTYTARVQNPSDKEVAGPFTVTVSAPAAQGVFPLTEVTFDGANCTIAGATATCAATTLPLATAMAPSSKSLTVKAMANKPATIPVTVKIAAPATDPNSANNQATVSTVVEGYNLKTSLSTAIATPMRANGDIYRGDTVAYTVVVDNVGKATAPQAILSMPYDPAKLSVTSFDVTAPVTCVNQAAGVLRCALGDLARHRSSRQSAHREGNLRGEAWGHLEPEDDGQRDTCSVGI